MLMIPGPMTVPPWVRDQLSESMSNPDIEQSFFDTYDEICEKLGRVYGTNNDAVVTGGEGILGLEAAIVSTVTPGDDVLCTSNGLCGDGFADFVESYGGEPTLVGADYTDPLDLVGVEAALDDGEFAVVTMARCKMPTGTPNDIAPVLELLSDYGVLTIVDVASSLGGAPVPSEHIDINLDAPQKVSSSPSGLTTAAVSDRAWEAIEEHDPDSLYTNLLPWRDTSEGSPYTHLSVNVAAFDESLSMLLEEGLDAVYERHEEAVTHCRKRGAGLGLDIYPDAERSSPTVTAFHLPGEAKHVQVGLEPEYGIVSATGLTSLVNDILRVGHMSYNTDVEKIDRVMNALEEIPPMKQEVQEQLDYFSNIIAHSKSDI